MHRTIPSVENGLLYYSETGEEPLAVGAPAWYDWLEHHTSFLFTDHTGAFTARKSESESSAQNWEAFRTSRGKLYRFWLGSSRTLSLARLQAAAQALFSESASAEPAFRVPSCTQNSTGRVPQAMSSTGLASSNA